MIGVNPRLSFKAAQLDIEFVRGDTLEVPVIIREEGEIPANIGERTFAATVRKTPKSETAIVMSINTAELVTQGKIVLSLSAAQTADFQGNQVYDLQQTHLGTIRTLIRGNLIPIEDVTRV